MGNSSFKILSILRKLRLFTNAIYYFVFIRKSYSQHGEDVRLAQLFRNTSQADINYVDVGCNHPMKISNTYLFYRNGARGVCIDANSSFGYLYRLFRRRDLFISVGVGVQGELAKFYNLGIHVLSSFKNFSKNDRFEYVPVLSLDEILKNMNIENISILSIDVEGFNLEVLKGATRTLLNVEVICIEFDSNEEKSEIIDFLSGSFYIVEEIYCNLILKRK